MPDTVEILRKRKERLYELSDPDPLRSGLVGRGLEFYEYMADHCREREFEGKPVAPPVSLPGETTDGVFTVAAKLRGTQELCLDMFDDPRYFHDLMSFVTQNVVRRSRALKEWRWSKSPDAEDNGTYRTPRWLLADDSVAILSEEMYREFVLPYHRLLVDAFSDGGPIRVHLCGDATHLFPCLVHELGASSFDTGFPVDFGALRTQVGPNTEIYGGPSIAVLKSGPLHIIRETVRDICSSGVMEGGQYVMREGNNLAPCTPVEHVAAMYDFGREYGVYSGGP